MASLDDIYAARKPAAPAAQAGPLDLHQELLAQYAKAKDMLETAELSDEPLNHRVAALNAISSCISSMVKLQSDLHTLEEIKKIENALIDTLKAMPEVREKFLNFYKGALKI
jgi:hypothetical protein